MKVLLDIGWKLVELLLPKTHDSASPTVEPRFRDAGASRREKLTYGLVWKAQEEIESRAVRLAGSSPEKWRSIITALHNFRLETRALAFAELRNVLRGSNDDARFDIWSIIHAEVGRQRQFPDADWTLEEADLRPFDELVDEFSPTDEVRKVRWLFDDWTPPLRSTPEDTEQAVEKARHEAISRLAAQGGNNALLQLAMSAKLPQYVATALVNAIPDQNLWARVLEMGVRQEPRPEQFIFALSAHAAWTQRAGWTETFRDLAKRGDWGAETTAKLLLGWPDDRETWTFVESFGADVTRMYWEKKQSWKIKGSAGDLDFAVQEYLKVKRPSAAVMAMHGDVAKLSSAVVFDVLSACAVEIGEHPERAGGMFDHALTSTLTEVQGRNDLRAIDIARLEYAFLPLLRHRKYHLTIHKMMAESAEFFMMIIRDVFKGPEDEDKEVTDDRRQRAQIGYRLLESFKFIPGMIDQTIDGPKLSDWISSVHALGIAEGRARNVDYYIGHTLAHSINDPDDNVWPHRVVRDTIEALANSDVERGIQIRRFNLRGATSRAAYEGGVQERKLAEEYREWARLIFAWPRTSSLLNRIAESWERDAEEMDSRARLDQMRR